MRNKHTHTKYKQYTVKTKADTQQGIQELYPTLIIKYLLNQILL